MEQQKTSSIYLALEPEDAALILRADGSFETSFPEDHSTEVPDHILTGFEMKTFWSKSWTTFLANVK